MAYIKLSSARVRHLECNVLAIIVPAYNEECEIGACLESLRVSARWPALRDEAVMLVVALDSCTDGTALIARHASAATVTVDACNVGIARAAGAALALRAGARWLACTDADTQVAPDWLFAQLVLCSDAVCGTVAVRDWGSYGPSMRLHYDATYTDAEGHRHIHGANLGVSAATYVRAGGFQPLVTGEDVALVAAMQSIGARIAWSATPRVVTSARRQFRAPEGFGATLLRVETQSGGAKSEHRP